MYKPITQNEIARRLKISQTTVSKALHDALDISTEVKKKVGALAEKYNYHGNIFARELVSGKRAAIGAILYGLLHPFYPKILESIFEESIKNNYYVIYSSWLGDEELRSRQLELCLQQRVAGIITKPFREMAPSYFKKIPTVIVDADYTSYGITSVLSDDIKGAESAVNYLIRLGHRRIAHLYGSEDASNSIERIKGYRRALQKAGIKKTFIRKGGSILESGAVGTQELLRQYPEITAIFAFNDHVAMGILQTLLKNGYRVPEDISLIGYGDDLTYPEYHRAELTTVRQPAAEMGKEATKLLFDKIDGKKTVKEKRLPCELIIRKSTAPPRKKAIL